MTEGALPRTNLRVTPRSVSDQEHRPLPSRAASISTPGERDGAPILSQDRGDFK